MTAITPKIWRINLKTDAKKGKNSFEFCYQKKIIGIGWQVSNATDDMSWSKYLELVKLHTLYAKSKSWKAATNALRSMQIGDLCWARNNGIYYLVRITGDWEYRSGVDHQEHDMVNVRACEWLEQMTVDEVPGKVESSFRPQRTLQQVHGNSVRLYSTYLSNKKQKTNTQMSIQRFNLFELLSTDDCEDLLGVYMQLKGYLIIPSSCKKSTQKIEWVAYHKDDGSKATAQVKTGADKLTPESFIAAELGRVFLFSPNQSRPFNIPSNVIWIDQLEITEMMRVFPQVTPKRVQHWIEFSNAFSSVDS